MTHQAKLAEKEEHPRRELPCMNWTCLLVLSSKLLLAFGVTFILALLALLNDNLMKNPTKDITKKNQGL